MLREKKGELDKAEADFNKALELDPYSAAAYFNRGHTKLKRYNLLSGIKDIATSILGPIKWALWKK